MSQYHHLTISEREKILFFLSQGKTLAYIANTLGRSKATISRELKRTAPDSNYSPHKAQQAYDKRRKRCHRRRLLDNLDLYSFVSWAFLSEQWSPEQISGRLKCEHAKYQISYSTIYRAIYAGLFDTPEEQRSHGCKGAIRKLRHRGKSRHTKSYDEKRGKIRISNSLEQRPIYRTNRGGCYSYQEGLASIDDLIIQAEKAREQYKTIIPANLESRITVEYTPRPVDGRRLWAQLGTLELDGIPYLFWKEEITYQFLEPYPNEKQLKKAYKQHEKQILENINNIPYVILEKEKPMERLYWSERHNRYATAEYVAFNG